MRRASSSGRRSRKLGWTVTQQALPSASVSGAPRTFEMVTDLADQRARRGGAERDGQRRADQLALLLDPPAAGVDLAAVGLGVDAPLAARDELEMLDRVGDVGGRAVDPGLGQRGVEQLPRGTDEGPAGKVLLVARLLADEQDGGSSGPSPNTVCVAHL